MIFLIKNMNINIGDAEVCQFNYRNKDLLWLKVDKHDKNYYYGYLNNKPITSNTLKYKDYIKLKKIKSLIVNDAASA